MFKLIFLVFVSTFGVIYSFSCILDMIYRKALKKGVSSFSAVRLVVSIVLTVVLLWKTNSGMEPGGEMSGPIALFSSIVVVMGLLWVFTIFDERYKSSEKTINKRRASK